MVLLVIPYVNLIFVIWAWNRVALRFGKSVGFTIGLVFFAVHFLAHPRFRVEHVPAVGGVNRQGSGPRAVPNSPASCAM